MLKTTSKTTNLKSLSITISTGSTLNDANAFGESSLDPPASLVLLKFDMFVVVVVLGLGFTVVACCPNF